MHEIKSFKSKKKSGLLSGIKFIKCKKHEQYIMTGEKWQYEKTFVVQSKTKVIKNCSDFMLNLNFNILKVHL